MKKAFLFLYLVLTLLYLELQLSLYLFGSINNFFNIIISSLVFGALIYLLSSIFKVKVNRVISWVFIIFVSIIFLSQFIYFKFYGSIISTYSFTNGGQVFQFYDMIVEQILSNIFKILLLLVPLIVFFIVDLFKYFDYSKITWFPRTMIVVSALTIYLLGLLILLIGDKEKLYSSYNLYFKVHSPLESVKKLGLITTMRLDFQRFIFGFEEKSVILPINNDDKDNEDSKVDNDNKKEEYNVLEIDFDKLIENSPNDTIKSIHGFMKNQIPSKKNTYTGMFEGKNLIVILGEAFSTLAINKDLTPTLYKLANEGFKFNNFYTPLFPVSTADGEYITATSLIPKEGVWSLSRSSGNFFPYSYPNVFEPLGYKTQAYHNHTGTYYDRDKFVKALGYDTYKACRMGLNINCSIWPESDLEMMQATINDYINEERFLTYYVTVSGHLNYTNTGNMMVYKNWKYVKDLPYSHKAKGYLAANIELDRAVEYLINELDKKNKLNDTVIVISGDHYPYGLTLDEVNELSTYKRDDDFEKHRMPLIIWNNLLPKDGIEVEKSGSSLDVLPTILNLFGIEYDSRLLIGRDILSDSAPLVIFSNRSFITERGRYNAITKRVVSGNLTSSEIEKIQMDIYNRFQMSRLILENDYYKYLKEYLVR